MNGLPPASIAGMTEALVVEHRPAEGRFICTVGGLQGEADYQIESSRMLMTRTWVDPKLQGRGVAAALVAAALDWARANGLKVVPRCSYVDAYLRRHPEAADLRA